MAFFDITKIRGLKVDLEYDCDLIEFKCWASAEKRITLGGITDQLDDESNLTDNNSEVDDAVELPLGIDLLLKGPDDTSSESGQPLTSVSDSESRAAQILAQLKVRKTKFEDSYPFEIDGNQVVFKSKVSPLQNLYLSLLSSSLLKITSAKGTNSLGHKFEHLSSLAVKNSTPARAKKHLIGSGAIAGGIFGNRFKDKVEQIAKCLNVHLRDRYLEEISKHNNGDGGLDWFVFQSFTNDPESHFWYGFVQCACGENWEDKQSEAHEIRWNKILQWDNPPNTLFITPKSLRKNDWKFSHYTKIGSGIIFFDRFRFIELAKHHKPEEIDVLLTAHYKEVFEEIENLNLSVGD